MLVKLSGTRWMVIIILFGATSSSCDFFPLVGGDLVGGSCCESSMFLSLPRNLSAVNFELRGGRSPRCSSTNSVLAL